MRGLTVSHWVGFRNLSVMGLLFGLIGQAFGGHRQVAVRSKSNERCNAGQGASCRRVLSFLILVLILCSASSATADMVLWSDNFDLDPTGGNVTDLLSFRVTRGTVDVVSQDFYGPYAIPGHYLDMDGTSNLAGRLESKSLFAFAPGTYILSFVLGGSQRYYGWNDPSDAMTVSIGSLYSETFTRIYSSPLETIQRSFIVETAANGTLVFDHAGGDNIGMILDDVMLSSVGPDAVPLPSAVWAGMTLLGVVGISRYFRRKNATA